tara:strand:- start:301 stop:456 length:156 start_codon:yes stop_codon:yes gene_type:complete
MERVGDLASVFLQEALPQFPCYSTYCANYAYVADALAQVKQYIVHRWGRRS